MSIFYKEKKKEWETYELRKRKKKLLLQNCVRHVQIATSVHSRAPTHGWGGLQRKVLFF